MFSSKTPQNEALALCHLDLATLLETSDIEEDKPNFPDFPKFTMHVDQIQLAKICTHFRKND